MDLADSSKLVAAWRSRGLLRWPEEDPSLSFRLEDLGRGSKLRRLLDPAAARTSTGLRSLLAGLREGLRLAPADRTRRNGLRLVAAVLAGIGAGGFVMTVPGRIDPWLAGSCGLLLLFGVAFTVLDDPDAAIEASRLIGTKPGSDRDRL